MYKKINIQYPSCDFHLEAYAELVNAKRIAVISVDGTKPFLYGAIREDGCFYTIRSCTTRNDAMKDFANRIQRWADKILEKEQ